jgi:iron complex outermembrane receptor protein
MSAHSRDQRVATLLLWVTIALCPLRVALASEKIAFDIPAGPASKTLALYRDTSGISNFVFPWARVRGFYTHEVRGEYDPVEALRIMLDGTRLQFDFNSEDSITVSVMPSDNPRMRTGRDGSISVADPLNDRRSLQPDVEVVVVQSRSDRNALALPGSALIDIRRNDIDAFGFSTTQDLLRTLPQVFGGGPTEDTHLIGLEALSNAGLGAGVNLRGFGAGATLVLVNGHRLAASGSEARFVDISNLPLSIIDRIEILPDSSSSQYGADAVGGVVNFMLMNSFDGAQTDAAFATATHGSLSDNRVSQILGLKGGGFDGLVALDFYSRDQLRARDRRLATSDLRRFGGSNFDTNTGSPGTLLFGPQAWAIPAGQDGTQLSAADLIPNQQNLNDRWHNVDLLPSQQRWSLFATTKKRITDDLEIYADALFNQRNARNVGGGATLALTVPTTNAFFVNPLGLAAPVQVAYDFGKDLGPLVTDADVRTLNVVTGVNTHWRQSWELQASGHYASEHLATRIQNAFDPNALDMALADSNPETAFNPFGDGSHNNPATLARIRDSSFQTAHSRVVDADIALSRGVGGLGGGRGRLATGLNLRREQFVSDVGTASGFQSDSHDLHRSVSAAFASLSVPLMGPRRGSAGPNLLEVSFAGRYEDYSDFGRIFTPRFGLTWSAMPSLNLRSTWSRSFKPPNLFDLDESKNQVTPFPIADAASPLGSALTLVQFGRNAQLREERAKSWTLGFDWNVETVPGLSTAFTYFHTAFRNRLDYPSLPARLTDPAATELVALNPTLEERQAACNSGQVLGVTPAQCVALPIAAIVDLRARNSALTRTKGIDMLGEYVRYAGSNTITFKLDGTYILSFAEAPSENLPLRELVSTQNNPIDLRLRASFDLQHGPLRGGAVVNFFNNYRDVNSTPTRDISSWTTVDVGLSYSLSGDAGGPLADTVLSLNAQNVFDRDPPFLDNAIAHIGYDQENGDLTGRIVSVSVRKNW